MQLDYFTVYYERARLSFVSCLARCLRFSYSEDTFPHHGEVDHLADDIFVAIALVGQDAVEEALVGARVIEGHVEQVDGGILDVVAPLAAVPVDAFIELLVFNHGAGLAVGVDLDLWNNKRLRFYIEGEPSRFFTLSRK